MINQIKLASEFQKAFKAKYNKYPYSLKSVAETKWWTHFVNFSNKSKLPNDSEKEFVKRLFDAWNDKDGQIYPFVLSQKIAYDIEFDMMKHPNAPKVELTETDFINITLKKAKQWCKQNNIKENQLATFLTNKDCIAMALRGEYYKPLFMFSKPFLEKYKLTEDDKLKKNSIRAFQIRIYEILKNVLGQNFVD